MPAPLCKSSIPPKSRVMSPVGKPSRYISAMVLLPSASVGCEAFEGRLLELTELPEALETLAPDFLVGMTQGCGGSCGAVLADE